MMKYDAMTLGSGDFVIGFDLLKERMKEAQFPLLSANVVMSDTGDLIAQPYVVKDLGQGYHAAIIGVTDADAASLVQAINGPAVRVLDPAEAVKRYVAEIGSRANFVIVLSHLGSEADLSLAEAVPGIGLIVGGKDGSIVPPTEIGPGHTISVQASSQGEYLGERADPGRTRQGDRDAGRGERAERVDPGRPGHGELRRRTNEARGTAALGGAELGIGPGSRLGAARDPSSAGLRVTFAYPGDISPEVAHRPFEPGGFV